MKRRENTVRIKQVLVKKVTGKGHVKWKVLTQVDWF